MKIICYFLGHKRGETYYYEGEGFIIGGVPRTTRIPNTPCLRCGGVDVGNRGFYVYGA